MSYRVNRALGFQKPLVTNPWVFADYGQPQRRRGYVSPIVFQTQAPGLRTIHLGDEASDRAARMERYTLIGLTLSVLSLGMFAYHMSRQRSVKNVVRNSHRKKAGKAVAAKIEDDTPIQPFAVADAVVVEASVASHSDTLTGSDAGDVRIADALVRQAQRIYKHNADFKKKVRGRGNSGRNHLHAFMRHWLASELKKKHPAVFRQLPHGWGWSS